MEFKDTSLRVSQQHKGLEACLPPWGPQDPPQSPEGPRPAGTCPEGFDRGLPQGRGLGPGAAGALRGAGPPHHEALHAAGLPSRKRPCSSAGRQAPLRPMGPSRGEDYISQQAARGGGGGRRG